MTLNATSLGIGIYLPHRQELLPITIIGRPLKRGGGGWVNHRTVVFMSSITFNVDLFPELLSWFHGHNIAANIL